ncbi:HTH domain-containing protein [Halorientalis pallida]|uniref:HTH domain-containing protein n=1 Tax=Halorientalis pallida TaxID=2479928 RepID=UPI003C6F1B05
MATNVVNERGGEQGETDRTTESEPETAVEADCTVTLHLRASAPAAATRRQRTVLDRLRSLASDGVVPDLRVERWSSKVTVPSEGDESEQGPVELYEEFETATERADARLEPFFETREAVGGLLSAGPPTDRVIVFPVVCLTVRRDGDLTGLYPCWKDGDHHSVEDGLEALATEPGDPENL